MNIDWSKAPKGATHWQPENKHLRDSWIKIEGGSYWFRMPNATCWVKYDRPVIWLSNIIAKPANAIFPWSGEGLPQVGTVCEFEVGKGSGDWRECEVIAIKDEVAVCWIHINKVLTTKGDCLRPIRTAEQIAAEKRLHQIRNALTAINSEIEKWNVNLDCSVAMRATVEAMIDAGYRKCP